MATITLSPLYPIPNVDISVVLTATNSSTNFFRMWATVAPTGSNLDNQIKSTVDPRNRVEVYSGTGGTDFPFKTKLTKGGKYTFVVQEYIKGGGYGGAYQGDPRGSELEEKNGSESTVYIYVGQRLTQQIGPPDLRSTLAVWLWDNTIRSTSKGIHGEDTPSITMSTNNDVVKSAVESATVKTALLGLIDQNAGDAVGDTADLLTRLFDAYNDHVINGTYHNDADTVNTISDSFASATTPSTLKEVINAMLPRMKNHFSNDNSFDTTVVHPAPIGPGYGDYHNISNKQFAPIYTGSSSTDDSYGALVDLVRCFNKHRTANGVHDVDDTNNVVASSALMALHMAYLEVISASTPVTPPAQSSGAQTLIFKAGFKEQ